MSALTASASTGYAELAVEKYEVYMRVREDRKIEVSERIAVRFLDDDLTMFYRSLPTDGARYENIQASCEGNSDFYFYVADNEEGGAFIDINCVGNAHLNQLWIYDISYLMEQGVDVGLEAIGEKISADLIWDPKTNEHVRSMYGPDSAYAITLEKTGFTPVRSISKNLSPSPAAISTA